MSRQNRLGIDLSGDAIALANVAPRHGGRIQLRGFAVLGGQGGAIADDLRNARRQYGFPRQAEVVAWAGDPRVQAVRQAGYRVERVISPGEALARVARLHQPSASPGSVVAVVALHPLSGALAIVRDGTVIHETPLTWSAPAAAPKTELLGRYSFLSELSELLRGSFEAVARKRGAVVREILTCGSLPDLRSFTMPLADEFDVEVETLDAADAVDVRIRKVNAEQLRDWIAALWVAMAAGRRWHKRPSRAKRLVRLAVPVGLAAGALYALSITGSRVAQAPADRPRPSAPLQPVSGAVSSPTRPRARADAPRVEPPAPARPTPTPANRDVPPRQTPLVSSPAAPVSRTASAPAGSRARPVPEAGRPAAASAPAQAPITAAAPPTRSVPAPAPVEAPRAEPVLSADFVVTSILWSAERQFAVIDGRIVAVGDPIDGARVVRIAQDAVFVRDTAGRLRRAALRPPGQMP